MYDKLSLAFGDDSVVMDIDSIPPGTDFRKYVRNEIEKCNVLLAVIGPEWASVSINGERRLDDPADLVRVEIETAFDNGFLFPNPILMVPILMGRTVMPAASDLPDSLKDLTYLNAVSIDVGRDFHPHMERLIEFLNWWIKKTADDSTVMDEPDDFDLTYRDDSDIPEADENRRFDLYDDEDPSH
jgi:hypothetical protein